MQYFKENDEFEKKVVNSALPIFNTIESDRDAFYNGAYTSYPLGDLLYLLGRDPMVGVILPETYRISYPAIHELFTRPATFEFYLNVLRAIWGNDANIEFSIPGPGRLDINIQALELELQEFTARYIVDNVYHYDTVVTQAGDTIVFQGTQGIKTQREADALINELAAANIHTRIDLTVTP